MTFEYTDKMISLIEKQLIQRYSRLRSLVSFDELNVMDEVNTLYSELLRIIKKSYLILAQQVYTETRRERDLRSLDEEWVDGLLTGYDPVSKYVFTHEMDRRCARLIEAVLASSDRVAEIDKALRQMSFMYRLYADRITDEAVMQAYEDDGIDFVKWVATIDSKTCRICRRRNGRIYARVFCPEDPHPNCRCRREPVEE